MPSINLRLAMRVEGNFWNAYVAELGTMDGALLLGSIAIGSVQRPDRKSAFMALMQDCLADHIRAAGIDVREWNDPVAAPAHELAGRA